MCVFVLIITVCVFDTSAAEHGYSSSSPNSEELVELIERKFAEKERAFKERERKFEERLWKFDEKERMLEKRVQMLETGFGSEIHNNNFTKRAIGTALPSTPVAFSACVSVVDLIALGMHHTIVFDHVTTNLGSGYHPHLGVFFAPRKGVYVFHITIIVSLNHVMEAALVKDGIVYHRISIDSYDTHNYCTTTGTWILELEQQSEVYVQTMASGNIHGNCYSTFSGFLLQELE